METATMLELFHFNGLTYVLTLAIFFTLLGVLSLKVWRPVLKALDERDEAIRGDLDQATASRAEAEALLEEQRKAMTELREEGKRIREEAVAMGKKQKEELLASAQHEVERLLSQSRSEMAREKDQMFEDVKNLVVDVGVDLAKKILGKEIDSDGHKKAIRESLADIEDAYKKAV